MNLDAQHIAAVCRQLRTLRDFTQETLAEAAFVVPRTIQKAESGSHVPDIATLRGIAKACKVDISVFHKPTATEEAAQQRAFDEAVRTFALVPLTPAEDARALIDACTNGAHGLVVDLASVYDEETLPVAAALLDNVRDVMDIWSELPMTERLEVTKDLDERCAELRRCGYQCCVGRFRQVAVSKPDLVFRIAVVTIRPPDAKWQYALSQVGDGWETHPDDRRRVAVGAGAAR